MTKIHNKSDFKLQIFFPNIEKNTLKAFTFRYYTNDGCYFVVSFDGQNYHNCVPCTGGVLAHFVHGNSEMAEFSLGTLQVKTEFTIPDAENPGRTITITDRKNTELSIVAENATFAYNPLFHPVIAEPSYNQKSPYPVHAVIFPQGDKGEKGKDAIIANPACLIETKCEGEFILEPDGVTQSQLYQKTVVVRMTNDYTAGSMLALSVFGWGYSHILSINGYCTYPNSCALGESLPISWWGNINGSIIPKINRNVPIGETWIATIKYSKNN